VGRIEYAEKRITITLTRLIVLMAGMAFLPTMVSAARNADAKVCAHTSLAVGMPGNQWYLLVEEYSNKKRVISE